jgi:hypothetical protein
MAGRCGIPLGARNVVSWMRMSIFARIIVGLVVVGIGFFMAWKTGSVIGMLGRNAWAERHMGAGGSHLFIKLCGVAACLIGIVIMTGLWNTLLANTLGRLLFMAR